MYRITELNTHNLTKQPNRKYLKIKALANLPNEDTIRIVFGVLASNYEQVSSYLPKTTNYDYGKNDVFIPTYQGSPDIPKKRGQPPNQRNQRDYQRENLNVRELSSLH